MPNMWSVGYQQWSTHCLLGINILRPKQNGRNFADNIFKCIFLNENVWIPVKISLKYVPNGPINNIPTLVQIMAWRRSGDKPLSEPMMVGLPTHICVTLPQWVPDTRLWSLVSLAMACHKLILFHDSRELALEVEEQISVNSLRPNDAIWCQWTVSSLVMVMACYLFGTKPLPK